MTTHEAVIVAGARTAIGTAFRGSLTETDAMTLGTAAVAEAVRRSGIDPMLFDDVILGESLYGGGDIARYAAIEAGLVNAPGVAHNRHCASGLATLQSAAASVIAGMDRVVVAGGVQSSPTMPKTNRRVSGSDVVEEDWLAPSHRETPDAPIRDMSITVGWNTAVKAGISREDMDAWAYRSHMRAVAGIDNGSFEAETFPLEVTRRDGSTFTFAVDEHPRRTSTLEKLASLKPLHPEIEGL
jgi:acetyl-CoA acetyltransferase